MRVFGVASVLCAFGIASAAVAGVRCENDSHGNSVCRDERGSIVATTNQSGQYSDQTGISGRIDRERGSMTYSDGVQGKLQSDGSIKFNNGVTCKQDRTAPNDVQCY